MTEANDATGGGVDPGGATGDATTGEPTPLLRIVNPDATPEEIAAIVAVFASLSGAPAPAPRRTPEWSAHRRKLRAPVAPGPGGWRASSLR